jgi:hypothetical protein
MVKYKEFFNMMFEQNKEKFQKFMLLCQDYLKDKKKYKEEFDREGREVRDIVEFWERKLCKTMEGGNKAVYSSNLAEKFREEVKKIFPPFEEIGVKKS